MPKRAIGLSPSLQPTGEPAAEVDLPEPATPIADEDSVAGDTVSAIRAVVESAGQERAPAKPATPACKIRFIESAQAVAAAEPLQSRLGTSAAPSIGPHSAVQSTAAAVVPTVAVHADEITAEPTLALSLVEEPSWELARPHEPDTLLDEHFEQYEQTPNFFPEAEAPRPQLEDQPPVETMPEASPAPAWVPPPWFHAYPSIFVAQITPELAPVAKVGGLADVVFGLSKELELRGNHVEIILPKYDCMRYDHIWGLCETFRDLWVPWHGGAIHCTVYFGFVHGRKCFFIEPHSRDNFFQRGCIYGHKDDVMRFAFFSRAAMEFLYKSGKQPEIIHCHDWQTALTPVFLYEIYKFLGMTHPRVCFTIHNFGHQGVIGSNILGVTGLNRPDYYCHYDRLHDNRYRHALNLMKGGIVYSNFVTTVSPRHAMEAKDQGQGFGLEPTLRIHHSKYGGVVNGVDYNVWNPEIDPYIPFHYGVETIDDKYKNKKALRDRLLIADNERPIVSFVGRLDPQKGLELIRHAIFNTLHRRGQFVLLGSSPDARINADFWGLKRHFNDNPECHIEIGFNEELSHLIYAGADIVLVPSHFEPCGLTQLIAMRYGTVPVVREVGGLADTVFDKDHAHKPLHERNGYVFRDYSNAGLESALGRAISCYYDYPEDFRELMKNGMRSDYSWARSGQDYLNIYHHIREK